MSVADLGASGEEEKGPLVYQESKIFQSEPFLCNVYDNAPKRHVTFEIYGLDTQDTLALGYSYDNFDREFRFNAELMNPNRKDGRFHWVIERLAIVTLGKERRLERKPDPSEEVPELPIYETNRKIPTGRMDLKERQRLREQMDMLDIKRAENIAKKRAATKQRFLAHLQRIKEDDRRRKQEVEEKIEKEREQRALTKEEHDRQQVEEDQRLAVRDKQRNKSVAVKEQRTEEQDEEEYKALRERWRVLDAEKAANAREALEKKEAERAELREVEAEHEAELQELQVKREAVWRVREGRILRKQAEQLKQILAVKTERQRQERMRKERNQEFLKVLHSDRQPHFEAQLQRTQQRLAVQEEEREAVEQYVESRALPKKVKTKGKFAKPKEEQPSSPKAKAKGKGKKKLGRQATEKLARPGEEEKLAADIQELLAEEKVALEGERPAAVPEAAEEKAGEESAAPEKAKAAEGAAEEPAEKVAETPKAAEKEPKAKKTVKSAKSEKAGDRPSALDEVEEKSPEEETEKEKTDKVLQAVEDKVRAEMAEEERRNELHRQRMAHIAEREQARQAEELRHMKKYREEHRRKQRQQEEAAAERHHIMKEREDEKRAAAERRKQEQERLQRIRDNNIAQREQRRLVALCA